MVDMQQHLPIASIFPNPINNTTDNRPWENNNNNNNHNKNDEPNNLELTRPMPTPSSTPPTSRNNGEGRRLACKGCRRRRKKCDMGIPCGNCLKYHDECHYVEMDLRKQRYSSTYVRSLELQIQSLKEALDKKESSKNTSTFANEDSSTQLPSIELNNPIVKASIENRKRNWTTSSLYPGGAITYRPKTNQRKLNSISISSLVASTSINTNGTTTSSASPTSSSISSQTDSISNFSNSDSSSQDIKRKRISDLKTTKIIKSLEALDSNHLAKNPKIISSLSNFYKWLYAGLFTFVHRESFLYGFFNHGKDNYAESDYCSIELIYSMCAIGSRLEPNLQQYSEGYYEKSKSMLLKIVFDEKSVPRITTVQALFCLAFYELSKGNNQLGWYFSGLAIRVGYEMGFHLDPKVWYTDENDNNQLTKSELGIRSRIYWGCYIADHFICLMLGKTSTLSVSNSTIPDSEELPEVEGTEEFRFIGKHELQISLPLKSLIILSRIVEVSTYKIFVESDEIESKLKYLKNFNEKVTNWRESLPLLLKWSKQLLKDPELSTDPTVSYVWYHYYLVLMVFNKPFVEENEESRQIIIDIIEELHILFDNFEHEFGNFDKTSLYQLYVGLMAIRCINTIQGITPSVYWQGQLGYFTNTFSRKISKVYELPQKMEGDIDFDTEHTHHNIGVSVPDFTLSNEIDDLIKDLFGPNLWNNYETQSSA